MYTGSSLVQASCPTTQDSRNDETAKAVERKSGCGSRRRERSLFDLPISRFRGPPCQRSRNRPLTCLLVIKSVLGDLTGLCSFTLMIRRPTGRNRLVKHHRRRKNIVVSIPWKLMWPWKIQRMESLRLCQSQLPKWSPEAWLIQCRFPLPLYESGNIQCIVIKSASEQARSNSTRRKILPVNVERRGLLTRFWYLEG